MFDVLSEIFRVQMQPDPAPIILGHSEHIHPLSGAQHKLLASSLITVVLEEKGGFYCQVTAWRDVLYFTFGTN